MKIKFILGLERSVMDMFYKLQWTTESYYYNRGSVVVIIYLCRQIKYVLILNTYFSVAWQFLLQSEKKLKELFLMNANGGTVMF